MQQIGDYLFEECQSSKLGEGAFGCVYRAEHVNSAIPVAMKKLPRAQMKWRELKAISQLIDSHVVRVICLLEDERKEAGFVAMELCDLDLRAYLELQPDRRLSITDLNTVVDSLARGCSALHSNHIVHRDIKPENILLQFANVVDQIDNGGGDPGRSIFVAKIADFGASRLLRRTDGPAENAQPEDHDDDDDQTDLHNLAGTPSYMAPEIGANVLSDRCYDAKVDLWSIGVVIYECLHGQVPFDESALCRLFLFAANNNYIGYSIPTSDDVPIAYRALIDRLLKLNSNERLSADQLFCLVVHQKLLELNDDRSPMVDEEWTSGQKRYRFRSCCIACPSTGSVQSVSSKWTKSSNDTNNNNIDGGHGKRGDVCCSSGHKFSPYLYAFHRSIRLLTLFVTCNDCSFAMRQFGIEC